ncbi:MAG: hypothetical protein ABSF56_01900 [Minisyncoccia bacterium]|jgi:hypothetical protein
MKIKLFLLTAVVIVAAAITLGAARVVSNGTAARNAAVDEIMSQ